MSVSAYVAKDKQRRAMRRNVAKASGYFAEWSRKTDSEAIESCESLLIDLRQTKPDYEQLIYELLALVESSDEDFTDEDIRKKEDELFKDLEETKFNIISLTGKITSFLKTNGARNPRESLASFDTSSSNQPHVSEIRLPKINIPKFDGDPRKFFKFKSIFVNLIHEDSSIPNVRKLYYLQDALEGKAEEFIRDVDMTETSYNTAWTEFLHRYENHRVIVRAHLSDLFEIKKIKDESGLRPLLDTVTSAMRGLKVCGETPDQWSTILSYFVSSKLDDVTRRDFENSIDDKKSYPSFKNLREFLETRASAVEERGSCSIRDKPKSNHLSLAASSAKPVKVESKKSFATAASQKSSSLLCPACNDRHPLINCKVFISKSPQERFDIIKKSQLCLNCFGRNHRNVDCYRNTCRKCSQKHNTLLHFEPVVDKDKVVEKPTETSKPKEAEVKSANTTTSSSGIVLLPTAVVQFCCGVKSGLARILTDPASQVSLISEAFIRRNRVRTQNSAFITVVEGVGNGPLHCSKVCKLILQSRFSNFQLSVECSVVPQEAIKYCIVNQPFETLKSELDKYNLAEASLSYTSTDMLIGAEFVEDYLLNETIRINRLTLRNSQFGWLTLGGTNSSGNLSGQTCHTTTLLSIERQLLNLWEGEQLDEAPLKEEHVRCVEHFESTYARNPDGRFVVKLPLKADPALLSNTKRFAENSVNRILTKPVDITAQYHLFIEEYKSLGHLSFVDYSSVEAESNFVPYYLPQLLVLRPEASTTKLRVVFHASYRNKIGKSLNDILLAGPTLQLDLFDIILRFRRHSVAFAADIEKMYRQIAVDPADRHLQKIIYRNSSSAKPTVGLLNTLTYGTSPASFIATKCLATLADEVAEGNPKCANAVRNDFYMDDLITGSDSVDEAIQLNQDVNLLLRSGKFSLRKYSSNKMEFLKSIEPNLIEADETKLFEPKEVKVLGLRWNTSADNLSVVMKCSPLPLIITKRKFLSEVASVFDVIGVLSPVTIRSKLLMQQLWREKINWDDKIPVSLELNFREYHADLQRLESLTLNRHYSSFATNLPFDLAGFADASEKAYSAVVYARVVIDDNKFHTSFVCAKTRVAPTKKKLTIPRLELQAAHLLSKLLVKTESILTCNIIDKHAFSDSTTVLNWLNKPPENWKQFVANRVREIQAILPASSWHYINTRDNPADLATRGVSVDTLLKSPSWINGPDILSYSLSSSEEIQPDEYSLVERKKVKVLAAATTILITDITLIENCSSYKRLIGIVGYMLRFIRKLRPANLELKAGEREAARIAIIRCTQHFHYPNEIAALQSINKVQKRSTLCSLMPFVHSDGLIRVGGRLRNSRLPFEQKHPVILPAKSKLVELYVQHVHYHYFHATKSFVLNFIISNIWCIGNLTAVVKNVIYNCVTCRRFKAESCSQIMGQLPPARVTASDAFSCIGVDFAGHFECKCTNHRVVKHTKVYVAIFICMASRAVHIEVVSNLTTSSFLDALKRLISRRGLPRMITSDNGRTFIGAKNYLDLTSCEIAEWASQEGIRWEFISPRSPHQGGLWEAAVKSAKYHLSHILRGRVLSLEDYITVFTQIEGILNSRPLNYRHSGDKSVIMLTPAHLVIGRPLFSIIEPSSALAKSIGARYTLLRQLIGSFWNAWSKNYLSMLQTTNKWSTPERNLSVGDVVLLRVDNTSPSVWPMAIVETVYPDKSGIVRNVDVRTSEGVYRRSIQKLIRLLEG